MSCTRIRHAVSARLDGEGPGLDDTTIDAHLDSCAACRSFANTAARIHRAARLAPAPEVPDLTPRILAAVESESSAPIRAADTQLALRWILVVLALVQIGVAVPALILGSDAGAPTHTARHLGSFDVAVAVGFLFAAWRPSRIPGLLPVVAALVACLFGSALLDVFAGDTAALGEAHHGLDVVGLAVLWLLRRDLSMPLYRARRRASPGLA
jgi:predicted anti-sigma-YlaC factor YlaD